MTRASRAQISALIPTMPWIRSTLGSKTRPMQKLRRSLISLVLAPFSSSPTPSISRAGGACLRPKTDRTAAILFASGLAVNTPMMIRSDEYRHFDNDALQEIRLPYGKDRFAMYVFLSRKRGGLADFIRSFDEPHWKMFNEIRHAYAPQSVWADSTQLVYIMGINPNFVGLPLAALFVNCALDHLANWETSIASVRRAVLKP
jgi:hypothetical protein